MKTHFIAPFFRWHGVALCAGGYLLLSSLAFSQGSLTPPGAPAPTMKRLDEIEPRTNLQATPVPPGVDTSDVNYHFIINQPGSYYLSANLGVTKPNGIYINTEGVTLDLNGFQVARTSGSGGSGIQISVNAHRTCVHNGSIKGFNTGLLCDTVFLSASGCLFRNLAVSGCTDTGIFAAAGSILEGCRAERNSGTQGIFALIGSVLTNCSARNNTTTYGISTGPGCSLTNCAADNNNSAATVSAGIKTLDGCTITGCTAYSNQNSNGTASAGIGIFAGAGSTIKDCTAKQNRGDGIQADTRCVLNGCASTFNGFGFNLAASGIATGTESTIVNCLASSNRNHGFSVDETTTLANCTASNNANGRGISGGNALSATNCTVSGNNLGGISGGAGSNLRACTVYKNLGTGPAASAISVLDGSTVHDCTVRENNGDGIRFTGGCRIVGNTCDFNGQNSVTGAGIHALFGGSRIEENAVTGNFTVGLLVDGTGNTIFKNSARGNSSTNYTIAASNDAGPISSAAAATSPWANIAH